MDGYYYLHENNELIFKHKAYPVEDLRGSDFVKAIWFVDIRSRSSAWRILVEALAIGANKERVKALAERWGCDDKDAQMYASVCGASLSMDGDQFCATPMRFENLQESPAGFGDTALEALAELCKALGFNPNKLNWHHNFHELLAKHNGAKVNP
jgi:hypothetical protein